MRYVDQSYWSPYIPKLLGTYERELAEYLEEAATLPFDTVVDIGAAEGYYAVGLALRLRNAQVIAFEMEPSAQELIRRLAQLNGVESRVALEGFCTCEKLSAALKDSGKTMLVCDAEGGEFTLLDPMTIPRLRECHILVRTSRPGSPRVER